MLFKQETLPREIVVRDYTDLDPWLAGFASGTFSLLFLIGRPGLGKSQRVKQLLDGRRHVWIEGRATPMAAYMKLFRHRDEPIVIDDEISVLSEPRHLSLMNCLCQTDAVKTLRWETTSSVLEENGVPSEFTTSSPVMVITNELRCIRPQVRALIDRGQPLMFRPKPDKVHRAAADWVTDREIYDFIGRWLPVIPGLSMRDYRKAANMKTAQMDWKGLLHRQWKCVRYSTIVALRSDPAFKTEEERVQAFIDGEHGSRATYFRCIRKLLDQGMLGEAA